MMIETTTKEANMVITIDADERIECDAEGRYRLIDTSCKLDEPILESEAIDILIRRKRRDLVTKHFPMHGFHAAPKADRTPTHKSDAY